MAHFISLSLLLALWLAPVLAQATPAAPEALLACTASMASVKPKPAGDIDYPRLNRALLEPDAGKRRAGLEDALARLALAQAPEASLVRERLQLALARAQAELGQTAAAMTTLKRIPVAASQAPEALALLAELELRHARPAAAAQWLRQIAALFPDEPLAIRSLWRAAELQRAGTPEALALWQQATAQSDAALAAMRQWQARGDAAGFLDSLNSGELPREVWRATRAALTDATFARAETLQAAARRQLQCLTLLQEARLERQDKHPRLLGELQDTVATLTAQLQTARKDLARREQAFLALSQRAKECLPRGAENCADLQRRRDAEGRALTGWRNRVRSMEGKLAFLREEQKGLQVSRQSALQDGKVAAQLADHLSGARAFMQTLLRQSLATSVREWEAIAAEAHYRLALAQEQQLRAGTASAP